MSLTNRVDGKILDVNTGDLGDANTSYTYIELGTEDMNLFSIDFVITATTITLEASNDKNTVANASKNWVDVTTKLTGAANATATGIWVITTPVAIGTLRVKRVTTNATNAIELRVAKSRA